MSFIDDMKTKQDATNAALAQLGTDLTKGLADLHAQIVAAGISPDQATALLSGMDDIIARIGTLDTQAKAE